jgi:MFS family permease
VLASITLAGIMANTLLVPVIPDILDEFDQPDSAAGVLVAAAPAPAILLAPVLGVLSDRFGRRTVLTPCLAVFGLVGVLSAFAPGFGWLVAARFVQGIGAAGLGGLVLALVSDHWEGEDRTRLIGYNSAVLTVGIAVLPPLGGLLATLGGWRWSFAPYALGVLVAAVVWTQLPAHDRHEGGPTVRGQLRAATDAVREPIVAAALAMGFVLFFLIFGLFLTVLPLLLEGRFGLDAGERGLVTVVPAVSSTVAALLLARLRRRTGAKRVLWLGTATLAVSYVVVGVAPALWVVLAASLAYGYAEGSTIPIIQDLVTANTPGASRGAVATALMATFRAGQTFGPLAVGASLGMLSERQVFLAGAAVVAGVTVAIVAWSPPRPATEPVGGAAPAAGASGVTRPRGRRPR